jgi:hypothetical protein
MNGLMLAMNEAKTERRAAGRFAAKAGRSHEIGHAAAF